MANWLSGTIPPEFGDLPNLVTLNLSYNRFSDPFNYDDPDNTYYEPGIPSELGNLKETLQYLDLGGNNLTGAIPPEIWELTELRTLRLHGNKNINGGRGLTGTIPPEVKNLTKLTTLNLHGNRFSGPIPVEIAQLSELESLTLYLNGFTGTIPQGLGNLPLTTLDLRGNQLTGSIPSELENLLPGPENPESWRQRMDRLRAAAPARGQDKRPSVHDRPLRYFRSADQAATPTRPPRSPPRSSSATRSH